MAVGTLVSRTIAVGCCNMAFQEHSEVLNNRINMALFKLYERY